MSIPLVNVEDVRNARGGGKKGKGAKYAKYAVAIKEHIPFLKDSISKEGIIRLKVNDIVKVMGQGFIGRNPTSIYWGLKYVLFHEGMVVTTGKHKDGDDVLVMRIGTPEDRLPDSLTKGEGEGEGNEDKEGENVSGVEHDIEGDEGEDVETDIK